MNSIKVLALITCFCFTISSFSQDESKRLILLSVHGGVGASNFLNAEPPHKLISTGDSYYVLPGIEVPELNYETNFWKDITYNFVGGFSLEYYLRPGLSLAATLNYEGKGIAINYLYEESSLDTEPMWIQKEDYSFDISNHYLSMPLTLRKYLNANNTFYLQGGVYLAYLLNSSVNISMQGAYVSNVSTEGFEVINALSEKEFYTIELNESDFDEDLTSVFDFGLVLGTGFNYPLSDKLYFNADLSVCIGLKDIDGVNNNEYSEVAVPLSTGYGTAVSSRNYYGLNSNAKNISGALTIGIGFRL